MKYIVHTKHSVTLKSTVTVVSKTALKAIHALWMNTQTQLWNIKLFSNQCKQHLHTQHQFVVLLNKLLVVQLKLSFYLQIFLTLIVPLEKYLILM